MNIRGRYYLLTFVIYLSVRDGNAENACKSKSTGAFLPDPRNCFNYIRCVHERAYYKTCSANLFFNPRLNVCDWQQNVKCEGNACSTKNGRCEHKCVYIDNNNYGCTCRSGFKLDSDLRSCLPGSLDMDTYCLDRHGEQLPDPRKCHGFIKCQGSTSIHFQCPPGTVYNDAIKVCDHKRRGVCKGEDFNGWSLWSPCFKPSLDEACVQKRIRNCKVGGVYCQGFKSQVKKCKEKECKAVKKVSPCELQNGGCTDTCKDVGGKAVCSCNGGRTLLNDKKSCTAEKCGMAPLRNDAIIGFIVSGQNVRRGGYPWQVAIYVLDTEEDGTVEEIFHCGGTLIDKRNVISAAHCFSNPKERNKVKQYKIVLGENDRNKDEGSEQVLQVEHIFVHKDFSMATVVNDIAMIRLSADAKYSNYIRPACLPAKNEELKVGTTCRITGWGKKYHVRNAADILQEITVPVVAKDVCEKKNQGLRKVTSAMICTGYDSDWKSACHGDSGGPLSCMSDDGVWKLYGVVSWGDPQCNAYTAYNVLTKVSHFEDWINETRKQTSYTKDEEKEVEDEEDEEYPEP